MNIFKRIINFILNRKISICNHCYNETSIAYKREVKCRNNKTKIVYDVYAIVYCERCNNVYWKRKIASGINKYDLYRFYGIDEIECLTKNYYKNGSNE